MNITERVAQIKQGQTSATAQVQAALQRAHDAKEYHALLSLTEERALQRAREIDEALARGEDVGALAGVSLRIIILHMVHQVRQPARCLRTLMRLFRQQW